MMEKCGMGKSIGNVGILNSKCGKMKKKCWKIKVLKIYLFLIF